MVICPLLKSMLIIIPTFLDHPKRVRNALHTLCILIYSIFKKSAESGFDILNNLMSFNEIDEKMKTLITICQGFLTTDNPDSPRDLCLKLFLILITGTDNVSLNMLLEYLMVNSLFDTIIQLLSDPSMRLHNGNDVVILLTLLVNYRKHEGSNPYVVQLSILADELALNG